MATRTLSDTELPPHDDGLALDPETVKDLEPNDRSAVAVKAGVPKPPPQPRSLRP